MKRFVSARGLVPWYQRSSVRNFTVFDVSNALRENGWLLPAYTFPKNREDLAALRVVVKRGFTHDMADLLLHDAQYTPNEFVTRSTFGHSTMDYAIGLAERAGARRLLLFHHDPGREDDAVGMMVELANDAAKVEHYEGRVRAAVEGETFTLGGG